MLIAASAILLLASWVLLFLRIEPVPTWFYVFAWYPTLILLDALASRLDDRPSMLWQRPMVYVFLWSPVVWFCFEVANFRLNNWYYVFIPDAAWERWCGIVLSFATVVPAVLLAERLLDATGMFKRGRGPALTVRPWELHCAVATGVGMGILSLAFPRTFFPLIWGAVFLVIDPLVYRSRRSMSLLGDLTEGRWGRIGRLLVGGLCIGVLWETYNFWARGKWIYTVPWLEDLKLFEMPPFGFVGFPVFALEAWSMYAGLCLLGVAVPPFGTTSLQRRRVSFALVLGALFSVLTLMGMEERTISSTVPRISELPGATADQVNSVRGAGIASAFDLAKSAPARLAAEAGLDIDEANLLVESARIATLRGIGNRHAERLISVGIESVCELSRQAPESLYRKYRALGPTVRPNLPEVKVWIRAARNGCATN